MKDKLAFSIFSILLGNFGIQYFYLGEYGKGILCLLFCWTAIPGIIGIVVGVLSLLMSDAEFIKKYSVEVSPSKYNFGKTNAEIIMQYKELLDKGAISEEEFQKKKDELL